MLHVSRLRASIKCVSYCRACSFNEVIMKVWIDADACPGRVKEIIFKASERTGVAVTLVANSGMRIPTSALIDMIVVNSDFDAADHYIVMHSQQGDLVITADVPLAALLVEKNVVVINSRGQIYTAENIKDAHSMRNLMQELRGGGIIQGGPPPFNNKDAEKFANSFDRELTKLKRSSELKRARSISEGE